MVEAAPPKAPENFANSVERNEDDFLQPDTTIKTAENFQFKREKVQFNSIRIQCSIPHCPEPPEDSSGEEVNERIVVVRPVLKPPSKLCAKPTAMRRASTAATPRAASVESMVTVNGVDDDYSPFSPPCGAPPPFHPAVHSHLGRLQHQRHIMDTAMAGGLHNIHWPCSSGSSRTSSFSHTQSGPKAGIGRPVHGPARKARVRPGTARVFPLAPVYNTTNKTLG